MPGTNPYRALFENAREGFIHCKVIRDGNGRIRDFHCLDVNEAFAQLSGTRGLKGRSLHEHAPEFAFLRPEVFAVSERALKSGHAEELRFDLGRNRRFLLKLVPTIQEEFVAILASESQTAAANNLKEVTQRLELATSSAKLGIWDWDIKNNIMRWNARMYELYGRTPDPNRVGVEIWEEGLHPEDRERAIQDSAAALRGERPWNTEFRVLHPGGKVLHLKANGLVLKDSAGRPERMIGINQDITAQKEAELALKRAYSEIEAKVEERTVQLSEERRKLEIALEASEMGIWILDMTTRKATTSLRHALIFGYGAPTPDWSFDRFLSHVHEDDRDFVSRTNHEAFAKSQPWHFECRIRRADGGIRWIEVHGAPAVETSVLKHYIGTIVDITERKKIETALRESEARLKQAEKLAHLGHWEIDIAKKELIWSDETYRIFGFEPQSLKPDFTLLNEFVLPEYRDQMASQRSSAMAGERSMDMTYAFRRPDGAVRMNHSTAVLIRGVDGSPLRLVGVVQDVTEQELLKKEAAEARDAAESANRAKDLFLATLSHELRSPLTAILTWTQLMERGKVPPEKIRSALSTIRESAVAQTQLISDLLDISRIISGKLQIEKERIPLSGTIRSAIETLRPHAEENSIRIEECFADDLGELWVQADPVRMKQVIWNLLSNAIKFTPSGGKIRIAVRGVFDAAGSRAEIVMEDSGRGIEPDFIPRLFTRFTQQDSSSIRAHGGLGLGLSIVHSLVQLHGGTIRAASDGPGKGSTFTISLPLDRAAPLSDDRDFSGSRKKTRPIPEFSPRPLSALKILIVEDDEKTRTALATSLASLGARVQLAASAKEGFSSCRQFKPDILVSDIAMPNEDGYSLIRKIRELERDGKEKPLPAVALTAYADPETREKALAAGFQLQVSKPVDGEALAEAILTLQRAS